MSTAKRSWCALIVVLALFSCGVAHGETSAPAFSEDLQLGSVGPEVTALQEYLNQQGFVVAAAGAGAPGHESDYFGLRTKRALIAFQEAHAAAILAPLGLTRGTGNFFAATRAFVEGALASPAASSASSPSPRFITFVPHHEGETLSSSPPVVTHTVGGTVTGLSGDGRA